LFGRYSLS